MQPLRTKATTETMGKLLGWDDRLGPCVGLPVCRTYAEDETPLVYSWWRPSWRERLSLLFGGSVRLCLVGTIHPPVAIEAERAAAGKETP